MGLLYPRLLAGQARPMHEEYRRLRVDELTLRVAASHDSAVYVATGGDRVSEAKLHDLRQLVVDIAKESGFPDEANRESRSAFDLRLGAALHAEMGLVPAEAASGDVWAFLALVLLPDVAYWRYPLPPGDRVLGTDLTRHVFGRMWWRAQLVHSSDDPDPYAALKTLGEAAFDQIYTRRRALGNSPHLVKGILRLWSELDFTGLDERLALRDFLMRLLRLAPFVLFESLTDQALDTELRVAAQETVTALLSTTTLTPQEQQSRIDSVFTRASGAVAGVTSPNIASAAPVGAAPAPSSSDQADAASAREPTSERAGDPTHPGAGPAPYTAYDGPGFGDPRQLGLRERAEAIAAVVTAEGPVQAVRVLRVITRLAGLPTPDVAVNGLTDAVKYARRIKLIEVEDHAGQAGQPTVTLRLPDQPACLLRMLGPRDLDEIPNQELAMAASLVQADGLVHDLDALANRTARLLGYDEAPEHFKEALFDALRKYGTASP
ncbi:DUF6339 family protein [Nonomuraea cavernae]|uniref:Uncharacterized protein n=1 Tax=Nonomuraea cavernae TaxID=2045107 RepID=A0A917YQT2_9ACTN|nr:DUF6339 family protein [Nonomuraea cavernae]MCA2184256.1 hypothetical protein [Nonomuraea cavernae]GGO64361.1 hypothetical protein GCM10012289_13600 [Nonomuraea cavernae]